jgi:ornithine cyclodeaminase/alanine dehydrogenase-like protein (mu-crystallin family)
MQAVGGPDAMRRAIELMERGYADHARGLATFAPRVELTVPPGVERPLAEAFIGNMLGIHPGASAIGGRFFASRPAGRVRPGDGGHGQWKLLWDLETLDLLCLMEDVSLHPQMVGAHVGVGIRWLARPDSRQVGILGSGRMAMGCLQAVCAVREIANARVYSPTPAHREAFAAEASDRFEVPVRAVAAAETAVRDADIVLCAASTLTALYSFDWLKLGAHVTSVGEHELDEASLLRGRIVPSTMDGLLRRFPPHQPFQSLYDRGLIPAENLSADLTQIVVGERPGRTRADEITIAIASAPGYQHAAAARWVYEEARRQRLGTEWTP